MTDLLLIVAAAAALGAVVAWVFRREFGTLRTESSSQLAERNAEVDRRLQGVIETMDRRLSALETKVDRGLESASETTN
jgi:Holliday junction resolvasome RuvABC endonuclease subunit